MSKTLMAMRPFETTPSNPTEGFDIDYGFLTEIPVLSTIVGIVAAGVIVYIIIFGLLPSLAMMGTARKNANKLADGVKGTAYGLGSIVLVVLLAGGIIAGFVALVT